MKRAGEAPRLYWTCSKVAKRDRDQQDEGSRIECGVETWTYKHRGSIEARSVMVVNEQNSWKLTRVILVRFYPPLRSWRTRNVLQAWYDQQGRSILKHCRNQHLKMPGFLVSMPIQFFFVFRVQLNKYDFRQVVTLYEQGIITTPSTSFLNSLSKTQTLKRSMVY